MSVRDGLIRCDVCLHDVDAMKAYLVLGPLRERHTTCDSAVCQELASKGRVPKYKPTRERP